MGGESARLLRFTIKGCKIDTEAKLLTPHCMLPLWISLASKDYRDVLSEIDVPTFLTYSGDGQLYSPAHGEYMKAHIKNSVLDIFPGCGHGLFMDDPEKFNHDYEEFLTHV